MAASTMVKVRPMAGVDAGREKDVVTAAARAAGVVVSLVLEVLVVVVTPVLRQRSAGAEASLRC